MVSFRDEQQVHEIPREEDVASPVTVAATPSPIIQVPSSLSKPSLK